MAVAGVRTPCAVAVAVAAGLLLGATSAAAQSPRPAELSAHGQTVKSRLGTYCVTTVPDSGGLHGSTCADAAPPTKPPRRRLTVASRSRVVARFRERPGLQDEVRGVTVRLARTGHGGYRAVGPPVRAVERIGTTNRWRIVLPRRLRRANLLEVSVRLPGGDAIHYVGLDPTRRSGLGDCPMPAYSPLRAEPLRGRRPRKARRLARSKGCELRVIRRDGEPLPTRGDLRWGRVNVSVRDGRVRRVLGVF